MTAVAQVAQPEGWIKRLQDLANETVERSSESMANIQRLLADVAGAGFTPEQLASELPRFTQEHGAETYQQLVRSSSSFLAGALRLAGRYRDDYLQALLPPGRIAELGSPPVLPPPPQESATAEWMAWYQLLAARAAEQQAWSARVYGMLLDEVAAGRLRPEAVQQTARAFVERRLPDYLAEMAELNCQLMADMLAVTDDSVDALALVLFGEAPAGESPADELTLDLRGPAGATVVSTLLVENSRGEPATVSCLATPSEGFGLVTAPVQFHLAAGESRTVAVHVTLPAQPTGGYAPAGTVVIRGQGERDLVVAVRASAEPAPSQPGPPGQASPQPETRPPGGSDGPSNPA